MRGPRPLNNSNRTHKGILLDLHNTLLDRFRRCVRVFYYITEQMRARAFFYNFFALLSSPGATECTCYYIYWIFKSVASIFKWIALLIALPCAIRRFIGVWGRNCGDNVVFWQLNVSWDSSPRRCAIRRKGIDWAIRVWTRRDTIEMKVNRK